MKCELVAALLYAPQVVFLDEPTIGLDVVSQKRIREFLKTFQEREGSTIILTSHYMQDIQELCGRVIIIDHGAVVFDDRLDGLVARYSDSKLLRLTFEAARVPNRLGRLRQGRGVRRRAPALWRSRAPRAPRPPGPSSPVSRSPTSPLMRSKPRRSSGRSSPRAFSRALKGRRMRLSKMKSLAMGLLAMMGGVTSVARADSVDDYLKSEMARRHIPGLTVAVVRDGRVVKQQGYGLRGHGSGRPRHCGHGLHAGLDEQAVHGRGHHAAGTGRQSGPGRCGRQVP